MGLPEKHVPVIKKDKCMHPLVFATNNPHKVAEVQAAVGNSVGIITLRDAGIMIDIPEPHLTLEANASEKSWTIHRLTGNDCFSEDTGLEVTALHGAPGVHSAYYGGPERSAQKNIARLLTALKDKPDRSARFRTIISLIWNEKEFFFEGICEGRIALEETGGQGFGYDPVFVPDSHEISFAQMSREEKNACSHRKKAVDKMVAFLNMRAANNVHQ